MTEEVEFSTFSPREDRRGEAEVNALLSKSGLDCESDIQLFVTGRIGPRLVACAGLVDGVAKCVAIDADYRGSCLALKLMNELAYVALERGQSHLFLYTKPDNMRLFGGCGFYPLVQADEHVCLMENTPVGIRDYCRKLQEQRRPGRRIGCAVLNANPFTLGHLYLVREALRRCDWMHVLVVAEDASTIAYADRLELVRAGLSGLERVTVHPGSRYMVSKATFPTYFIKDSCLAATCAMAVDLQMFRRYIAPALGITHRFVGTEPYCRVTRQYNEAMHRWLESEDDMSPVIHVVEMPRLQVAGRFVSASEVRRHLANNDFEAMAALVPATTLERMRSKYRPLSLPQKPFAEPRLAKDRPGVRESQPGVTAEAARAQIL